MNGGKFISASTLLLIGLFSGVAAAQETAAEAKAAAVDPSGTWSWEYSFNDDEPAEFSLKLNWDGKQLTGKYTAFENTTDIEEAKFEDGNLSFISKREFNGNKFTVHFDGKAEPNDIIGKVALDFGEGPREFDWHAKRIIDADSVLGTWKLKLETPNGVIEPQLTITQDGDKLKGHYVSPFGEREAKDVAFKDGELSWRIESGEDDDFDFEIVYRGKPQGDKITGSNEYDFGGNTGTMDFTGERTPPDAKAANAEPAKVSTESASPAAAAPATTSPAAEKSE
jgi:hypothetical protein